MSPYIANISGFHNDNFFDMIGLVIQNEYELTIFSPIDNLTGTLCDDVIITGKHKLSIAPAADEDKVSWWKINAKAYE